LQITQLLDIENDRIMKTKLTQKILALSRVSKRSIALVADLIICLGTVLFAYWLRVGTVSYPVNGQLLSYGVAIALALPLFVTNGLYRAIFRYAGWGALKAIVRACLIYGTIYAAIFTVIGISGVPRSLGILQPILLFLAVGSSRAWIHYWLGGQYRAYVHSGDVRKVLIYGAGAAGRQLAAGLANSHDLKAIAFVDDDPTLHASVINGRQIYPPSKLATVIEKLEIDDVLLAIPSASRQRRNEIIEALRTSNANIRTLPGINDLAHGRVTVNDLRELDIEDLLGRNPIPPNPHLLAKNIQGKTVLVTGAGGSIGSELCRQVLAQSPQRLLLFDHSEFNLYAIEQELQQRIGSLESATELVALLGSVDDKHRVEDIFDIWRPHTVYHAAAYKHVPLVEKNPAEGVRNNIFGTKTLAEAAEKYEVCDFVLISTDKAVRPTNIMGATKRVAEMTLQSIAAENPTTCFSMVRFGNVLGSSGSVLPLFRKQIAAGGPVTVTHEEVTRYFMTIPEAAQLVIQAGAMAKGGEVFILDMGQPVKIMDLAVQIIELSGLTIRNSDNPHGDIDIMVTGLRPAEKLYEELLIGDNPRTTTHPRIMMALDSYLGRAELNAELHMLQTLSKNADITAYRNSLGKLVPELSGNGFTDEGAKLESFA
jgi:FlaA1/EpsC-like NDP-sugar epimerase